MHCQEGLCTEILSVGQNLFADCYLGNNHAIIFFRTMLARWHDLQRKEAGKGIKVV